MRTIPIRAARTAHDERSIALPEDRKSTRLNSSHSQISYAVFCLKKKHRYSSSGAPFHAPEIRQMLYVEHVDVSTTQLAPSLSVRPYIAPPQRYCQPLPSGRVDRS